MERRSSSRGWTLIGTVALALTVGVVARQRAAVPAGAPMAEEGMRDAVASPMLVAAAPRAGWIASPSMVTTRQGAVRPESRRIDQDKALTAARLRKFARAAREKADSLRADAARQVSVE